MAKAQFLPGKEVSGAIYLHDGVEIIAPFVYHEKEQVLVLKKSLGVQIYTTFRVDSFFFYDPEMKWQRRFRKMDYREGAYFFETVTASRVSILRLKLPQYVPDRMVKSEEYRHSLNYRYFAYFRGKLTPLKKFSVRALRHSYPEAWEELRKFARSKNISYHQLGDKIRVINKLNDILKGKDSFSVRKHRDQ